MAKTNMVGKVTITQDDYDKLLETFDKLDTRTLDTTYVPSQEDVDKKMLPYITTDKMVFCYLMWLDAEAKVTPENKKDLEYISKVIREHVVIINQDTPETSGG